MPKRFGRGRTNPRREGNYRVSDFDAKLSKERLQKLTKMYLVSAVGVTPAVAVKTAPAKNLVETALVASHTVMDYVPTNDHLA